MEIFDGVIDTRIIDSKFHMQDEQQIAALHTLERVRQDFEQPLPHSSVEEAVAACHQLDPRFAQHAYQNLVDLVRSAETQDALDEFAIHGRAAVFEAIVAYVLPYMLGEHMQVLPSAETKRLWAALYDNKSTEVRNEVGFRYRKMHSPDVVVFDQDREGNMGIATLIEATCNANISGESIHGKARHSAFAMMRSQKRGLGLFASDSDITMVMAIPNDLTTIHHMDAALLDVWGQHDYSRRGREVSVKVVENMVMDGRPTRSEVLVRINALVMPVDRDAIHEIYENIIQHYRPEGNEKYPTIEELLLAAPYGMLDMIELPRIISA